MPSSFSRLNRGAECACGNGDAVKFRRYYDREEDELLGLQCLECDREYLKGTFFALVGDRGCFLQPGSERFYLADRFHIPEDDAHMVHSAKTKIHNVIMFGDYLKPGEHIAWHRPYGIWHHAIVTEIGRSEVQVIHWHNKTDPVTEEWIDLKKQRGSLYRMDYQDEIVKANPARLVIARARSRLGEKGYNIITNNCEAFATFCKIGFAISQQIRWVWKELKNEFQKNGLKTFFEVFIPETAEGLFRQSQWFGAGFLFIFEAVFSVIDIKRFWEARKDGSQSRKEFIEQVTTRVTQAILGGGVAALGGAVPIIGLNFALGFLGGILGKLLGSVLGPLIGQLITSFVKYDDRAVGNVNDLRSGDHLVLDSDSQGSHHCIVQWYDEKTNKINIIHNTEKDGIRQDWVDFVQPVYKVIYEENECYTPHEVWTRAVSMLGVNEYNAKTNNSKHFAQWCCKNTDQEA